MDHGSHFIDYIALNFLNFSNYFNVMSCLILILYYIFDIKIILDANVFCLLVADLH